MNNVVYLILSIVLSFLITFALTPHVICLAFKKQWFDAVDARKIHHGLIPRVGGMVFVPSALISCIASLAAAVLLENQCLDECQVSLISFGCIFVSLLMIYAEGIVDDIKGVGYKVKFFVHFLCALLVVASGVWINNFYGLFGLYEIPWVFGVPFSILLIMFVINAVNLIDGIDGLCSGLTMVAFLFLATLFYLQDNMAEACLSLSMFGALASYHCFNVFGRVEKHSKIFMGDCGSQVLGLLLGVLAVRYAMYQADNDHSSGTLIVAFSLMIIPCLDVIRVMLGRIRRGANPFLPDKTHIHHLLLAKGWTQRKTRLFIIAVAILFVVLNLVLDARVNVNIVFAIDIALYLLLQQWIVRTKNKVERL